MESYPVNGANTKPAKSFVEMMNSSDYKERCTAEYVQTKVRYDKLHRMIVRYEAGTLDFVPSCSLELLKRQAVAMGEYLHILEIRSEIEKFPLEL